MAEDADGSSRMKGLVAAAKEKLAKATEAVTGLIKKDGGDDAGGAATPAPSERSKKMKAAVDEARKARED
jgi:hypothetical protein